MPLISRRNTSILFLSLLAVVCCVVIFPTRHSKGGGGEGLRGSTVPCDEDINERIQADCTSSSYMNGSEQPVERRPIFNREDVVEPVASQDDGSGSNIQSPPIVGRNIDPQALGCHPPIDLDREKVTACPDESFLFSGLRLSTPAYHHWIVVDIGANKGYGMLSMYGALGVHPKLSRDPHVLRRYLQSMIPRNRRTVVLRKSMCGSCGDCMRPFTGRVGDSIPIGSTQMIGFEPNPVNAHHLTGFFTQFPNVTIIGAAMGKERGNFTLCIKGDVGEEMALVVPRGAACQHPHPYEEYTVPIPVDVLVADEVLGHLPYIDFLMTDVEGLDYDVAQGARKLFESRRIRMYQFEMHGKGFLNHTMWLERLGYVCFFPVHNVHVRQRSFVEYTGSCWRDDEYGALRGWMNGCCVLNSEIAMLRWIRTQCVAHGGKE